MVTRFVRRHVVGLLALGVALGGTAIAAGPSAQSAGTKVKIREAKLPSVGNGPSGVSSVTVSCKKNEYVTGGGYRFVSVNFKDNYIPTDGPQGTRGWSVEMATVSEDRWQGDATAYAVCAKK